MVVGSKKSEDGLPPTKILLVDDHPANLVALEAMLEPLGQTLVRAHSGSEALRLLLDDSDFAVILLDVQMPDLDGYETAAMVRERESTNHIPIIFLTAINRDAAHAFRGYARGAVDYMTKPFDPEVLRAKVRVFVVLHRQRALLARQAERLREQEIEALERRNDLRFRALMDAIPEGVWAAGARGGMYYSNPRAQAYARDDAEAVAGDDARECGFDFGIVHPAERDVVRGAWRAAREAAAVFEVECRLRRRDDGAYRWHVCRALPQRDEAGAVAGWIATATDIDAAKRAEEAQRFLAEAGTRLVAALDDAAVLGDVARAAVAGFADRCVVHLERAGRLEPVAVAVAGGDAERALAAHAVLARPEAVGPAARVVRTGATEYVPDVGEAYWRAVVPDGATREALAALGDRSLVCAPLAVEGRVFGAVTFASGASGRRIDAQDVAAAEEVARRVAVALDRARLFDEAQRATRARDELLAVVSHDLRSPLQSIVVAAALLARAQGDPEVIARKADVIRRSAARSIRLVEDLLDISAIEAGRLAVAQSAIGAASIVHDAAEALRTLADEKSIALVVDVPPDLPAVHADRERMLQVFANVIGNAIKFVPAGGTITLRARQDARAVRFAVADTGPGIPTASLVKIFDRFWRGDGAGRQGAGLGLSIVKGIIDAHGGEVRASSEVGVGTTIEFTIPVAGARPAQTASA